MNLTQMIFLFALISDALLLFGSVFFIIMFSDLESDFVNPIDLCLKLNQFVIPDHALHALITFLFLISGQWIDFVLNLPLLGWHAYKYLFLIRLSQNKFKYDATEIFRKLGDAKKESFAKLGFYLLCFFFYLYRMIEALVSK
jgi:hypothetical protein